MKPTLLTLLGILLVCAPVIRAADTHRETVLIASEKSAFFDGIVDLIKPALSDRGVPCIASDLKSLDDSKIGSYLYVVILSNIKGSAPAGKVTAFFKRLNEREKKKAVLLGGTDKSWVSIFHGADVITASPKAAKVDSIVAVVLSRIDATLELNRGETPSDSGTPIQK